MSYEIGSYMDCFDGRCELYSRESWLTNAAKTIHVTADFIGHLRYE